jgi:minor extracellular serine protease Vpr
VRRLRAEVFDANTGRAWHRAFDLEYVGRNSTLGGFFALSWDGVTINGRRVNVLPDGEYVIKLSVQKALGDPGNPDHWESWTSPVITIERP